MRTMRGISLTNFLVASSALGFQVFVLYPWHKRLDEDFDALRMEHLGVVCAVEGINTQEAKKILSQLEKPRSNAWSWASML
jgi:hypothetical protein